MSDASPPFTVALTTPGEWLQLDPVQPVDGPELAAIVDERLSNVPELADHRADILAAVSRTLANSHDEGLMFAAVLANVTQLSEPVIASLAVVVAAAPPPEHPEAPAPVDVEALTEALAPSEPGVQQRAVDIVSLPGGAAMRVARLHEISLTPKGPSLIALSVQYWFTVPGVDQFVVLNFVSPTVGPRRALQVDFHRIASSFEFVAPDASQPAAAS